MPLASTLNGRHAGRGLRPLALFIALVGLVLLSGCSLTRIYESALVLADAAAGDAPSRFKSKTAAPSRATIDYRTEGRERRADLYAPGEGHPRAGIVLVPGVVAEGKDEPRLTAFARTLARAGFAVLVPEIAGFRELRIHPDDAVTVADAFRPYPESLALAAAAGKEKSPGLHHPSHPGPCRSEPGPYPELALLARGTARCLAHGAGRVCAACGARR